MSSGPWAHHGQVALCRRPVWKGDVSAGIPGIFHVVFFGSSNSNFWFPFFPNFSFMVFWNIFLGRYAFPALTLV